MDHIPLYINRIPPIAQLPEHYLNCKSAYELAFYLSLPYPLTSHFY